MSLFRVALTSTLSGPNTKGGMDTHARGAVLVNHSAQRGIFVPGPNKINRLLLDGDTFTDCNYWKRFAVPQVSDANSFIVVVTDDGSPYSDFAEENLYPVAYNNSGNGITISATTMTVVADAYDIDVLTDSGNYATFTQIEVTDSDVMVRINSQATIKLVAGSVQTFNKGDLPIGLLEFYNTSGVDATVSVLFTVLSACDS